MARQHPKIALHLGGSQKPADLSDFANAVAALRNSLRNVSRCAVGKEDLRFDVTELRIGSADIATSPSPENASEGVAVVALYEQTVNALENYLPLDRRIDYSALHAFNGFSGLARNDETGLMLGNIRLTKRFADRVAQLLEPDSSSHGSVSGRLEGVSIHGSTTFTLYPAAPGEEVECVVDPKMFAEAVAAIGKHLTVHGVLHFVKTKIFPVRVEVSSFEILPEESSLPTLLNAFGSLNLSSPSVDTIREMRDDWQ